MRAPWLSFRVGLVGSDGGAVAVPVEGGLEGLVEGRRVVPEGGPELAVVDHPPGGELVEGVPVLTHRRLEDADGHQGGAAGGDQVWAVTGEPVHLVDQLPGGARFRY